MPPVVHSRMSIPYGHSEGGERVIDEGRITVHEAAKAMGLSVRQMRRYKARLGGKLEVVDVVQPQQEVLTFDRQAVERFKAEREGRSVDDNV